MVKILITEELLNQFAEFSGDKNPLHLDESFAERTPFKKRIAHGTIILAKISEMLTEKFGEGNILLNEEIKFLKPAYIGDLITLNIVNVKKDKRNVNEVVIEATNQKKEIILECKAACKNIHVKNGKSGLS